MSTEMPPWMPLVLAVFALVITGLLVLRSTRRGDRRVQRVRYYAVCGWDNRTLWLTVTLSGRWIWLEDEASAATFSAWNLWAWLCAKQKACDAGREAYREAVER